MKAQKFLTFVDYGKYYGNGSLDLGEWAEIKERNKQEVEELLEVLASEADFFARCDAWGVFIDDGIGGFDGYLPFSWENGELVIDNEQKEALLSRFD